MFSAETPNFSTLSRKSTIILFGGFSTNSFYFWSSAEFFLLRIACAMSLRSNEESKISAETAPTPFTEIKRLNISFFLLWYKTQKQMCIFSDDLLGEKKKLLSLKKVAETFAKKCLHNNPLHLPLSPHR